MSRRLTTKISMYTVVGIAATVVYIAISSICGDIAGLRAQFSSAAGVSCAAIVSYFGHKYLTFEIREKDWNYSRRFGVQVIMTYGINILIVAIVSDFYKFPLCVSTIFSTGLLAVINYFIYDNYTFQKG